MIELCPNCSELVCRLDIKRDKTALKNAGLEITGTGENKFVYDKEYDKSLRITADEFTANESVVMTGDCDWDDFPTLEKIVSATGNDPEGYDGGHTSSFEEFLNNRVTKIKLNKQQEDKLLSTITLEVMMDNTLNSKRLSKYIRLKTGEKIYLPKREAQLIKKHLHDILPDIKEEKLLGEDYKEEKRNINMIELTPNCSESCFRINISNLDESTIKTIKKEWDKGVKKYMEESGEYDADEDWKSNRPEGSEIYEKKIFGTDVLEANGDFPYNCSDEIAGIVEEIEKKIKRKLETQNEGE